MIVNELVDSKLKSIEPRLLLKRDLKKTFDMVFWKKLFYMFGFREK